VVELLEKGVAIEKISNRSAKQPFCIGKNDHPQTKNDWKSITLHSFDDCLKDKTKDAFNFKIMKRNRINANRTGWSKSMEF
jgi:hypothetical protein